MGLIARVSDLIFGGMQPSLAPANIEEFIKLCDQPGSEDQRRRVSAEPRFPTEKEKLKGEL